MSRIKVNCYTSWKKDNLICLCKVGNPACDRYKKCSIVKTELENPKYKGIKSCFKQDRYGR